MDNPFLTPYPPADPGAAPGIKPFTAVDLVPPAGQNGPRPSAPPQASPFLDKDFSQAFLPRSAPTSAAPAVAPGLIEPVPGPIEIDEDIPARVEPDPPPPVAVPAPPRRGAGTETFARSSLTMTDADAGAETTPFPITTGPAFESRRILSYLGVVSVEIVVPKDLLFRNPAPYGELHRIKAAEDQLQRVKQKAFEELAERARALGANGITGAGLQFSQFDAVVFLCAALGTAVKVE